MIFDAIILAGGRSSRLDGVAKESLARDHHSLLELALAAAEGARARVVVGDGPVPDGVLQTREHPPFGGPAAAIAAGRAVLPPSDFTLVLACDMPAAAVAVSELIASAPEGDGRIAVDAAGREQYLLALYRTASLDAAIASSDTRGLAVRALVAALELEPVAIPPGSSDDVDTWGDAERLGFAPS